MSAENDISSKYLVTTPPPLQIPNKLAIILIYYITTMACVGITWSYYYIIQFYWWTLFLLPLEILGIIEAFAMTFMILVKVSISITCKNKKSKEGLFDRDSEEIKDYKKRAALKYMAIWFTRLSTFPWIDKIAYTLLGVKIGKTVVLHEAWVDTELIEVGDYVMIGMNSVLLTHCVYKNKVLIKKIKIGDNSIIGAFSIVAPGSKIGDSSVLGAGSCTIIDQDIDDNSLHVGYPARKIKHL
ncbi:MAG: acyltransferase [Promethearchaeota archaeon]